MYILYDENGIIFKTIYSEVCNIEEYIRLNNYNDVKYLKHDYMSDIVSNYKVISDCLIPLQDYEKYELKNFNRLLTEEERLLDRLKPSVEEIQKAEETLRLLDLLQEVM